MTRKKVKLEFINNDSSRKATYKKRKRGLLKKVDELTTLCGIDACAIIYSPYESQPEVWPNPSGAQRVVEQFKSMPEMEQSKKMMNQESFIKQRIAKATEQLKKQLKENREKEMTEVMYQCVTGRAGLQNLTMGDLHDLGWVIDQKLKEINNKTTALNGSSSSTTASQIVPVVVDTGVRALHQQVENPAVDLTTEAMQQRPQWFVDFMNNPNPMGFSNQMNMPPSGNPNPMGFSNQMNMPPSGNPNPMGFSNQMNMPQSGNPNQMGFSDQMNMPPSGNPNPMGFSDQMNMPPSGNPNPNAMWPAGNFFQ